MTAISALPLRGRLRLGFASAVRLLDLGIAPRPSTHTVFKNALYIGSRSNVAASYRLDLHHRDFSTSSITHASGDASRIRRIAGLTPDSPESDHALARLWLDGFEAGGPEGTDRRPRAGTSAGTSVEADGLGIPASAYEMTMSRSSGPGGQNVNKLSTKATIRLALPSPSSAPIPQTEGGTGNELVLWNRWLPWFVVPSLWKSPYYASDPPSLLLSCSSTRYAHTNRQLALGNLHAHICDVARSLIVNPTSDAQRAKVRELESRDKARRKREKELGKSKKQQRRKGGWD